MSASGLLPFLPFVRPVLSEAEGLRMNSGRNPDEKNWDSASSVEDPPPEGGRTGSGDVWKLSRAYHARAAVAERVWSAGCVIQERRVA